VDYPKKNERCTVMGQFVLNDPQAATTKLPNLTVGLAHPDYPGNGSEYQRRAGNGKTVTWAHDGNYCQFWTDGNEDGTFTIPNVRAGNYTLHPFANGVLGEFAKADVTVAAGKPADLGKLEWKPVRYGQQLWEIGYPDCTSDKFLKGDGANYWRWGWRARLTTTKWQRRIYRACHRSLRPLKSQLRPPRRRRLQRPRAIPRSH
jgi:rhamnogalacturonan endolyase